MQIHFILCDGLLENNSLLSWTNLSKIYLSIICLGRRNFSKPYSSVEFLLKKQLIILCTEELIFQ